MCSPRRVLVPIKKEASSSYFLFTKKMLRSVCIYQCEILNSLCNIEKLWKLAEKKSMAIAEDSIAQITESETLDFRSLLSSTERDYLIRNNGDHVSFFSSYYLIASISLSLFSWEYIIFGFGKVLIMQCEKVTIFFFYLV